MSKIDVQGIIDGEYQCQAADWTEEQMDEFIDAHSDILYCRRCLALHEEECICDEND